MLLATRVAIAGVMCTRIVDSCAAKDCPPAAAVGHCHGSSVSKKSLMSFRNIYTAPLSEAKAEAEPEGWGWV